MRWNKIGALLLSAGAVLVLLAGPALGQATGNETEDEWGADWSGAGVGIGICDDRDSDGVDANEERTGIARLSDLSTTDSTFMSRDQDVSVDESDILLAIALANNGAEDVSFDDLRKLDLREVDRVAKSQDTELDRSDVFSALALGVTADEDEAAALGCVNDVTASAERTRTLTHSLDLAENDVLLAIALHNSVGSPLSMRAVADVRDTQQTTIDRDQTVDVDREGTFNALALGAGGSATGGTTT